MRLGYFTMPMHPLDTDYTTILKQDREAIILCDKLGYYDAFVGEHLSEDAENITNAMLFLGTLLDTASVILIVVPLFIDIIEPMGLSLVWFGIITVIGAEIGLLTPPLGISCFVIKITLNDDRISLKDVFLGALPFAAVMLVVLILLIWQPGLSTYLLT